MQLARKGRVLCPLAPVHAFMCFLTLCANLGLPCATSGARLVDAAMAEEVLVRLTELAALVPQICLDLNPIGVLEKCFKNELTADRWLPKLKEMIPSYGESLIEDAALSRRVRADTAAVLHLQNV